MDDWTKHIEDIERKLLRSLMKQMEIYQFADSEIHEMATFVLEKIDRCRNHDELMVSLNELAKKWPFFGTIVQIEKGEIRDFFENRVTQDVLNLAKKGKVDDAIALVKTVTEN